MNNLLIFFALPVATIILAIVLQKILRSPLLVAATTFAIYLIVTFAVFDINFLVYTIIYTILAFTSAVITKWICTILNQVRPNLVSIAQRINQIQNGNNNSNQNDTTTISTQGNNFLVTTSQANNNTCGCGRCNRYTRR